MRTKDHRTHVVENNATKVTVKVIILKLFFFFFFLTIRLGSEREGLAAL